MKTDKEIYDVLIPYAKKRAGECEEDGCIDGSLECPDCYGRGGWGGADVISDPFDMCTRCNGTGSSNTPCPTCSGIREVAGMCWHEWKGEMANMRYETFAYRCTKCNKLEITKEPPNPQFTIPFIVETFKKMGVWEEFIDFIAGDFLFKGDHGATLQGYTDVLTTEPLMREAAYEFLKEAV